MRKKKLVQRIQSQPRVSIYDANLREYFPIGGIVHELLHTHYRHARSFFYEFHEDNDRFRSVLEHINIKAIDIELSEQLGTTGFSTWVNNWVLEGFYIPQLDDFSESDLINEEYTDRLKMYRPFE